MPTRYFYWKVAFALLLWFGGLLPLSASPWAEVGDNQLRADIELLQSAGVIEEITIQWPIPWESLRGDLSRANLIKQAANLKDVKFKLMLPGVSANTSATDFYPIEQLQMMRLKGEQWELFGPVINARSN